MNISSLLNFSFQESGTPRLSADSIRGFEIPAVQDEVELIAQQSIQQLSGSNGNNFVDVRNLIIKPTLSFLREECITLVNAKIARLPIVKIIEMFPRRTFKDIEYQWKIIYKHNPELKEKIKLAWAEQDAPVEVELENPTVRAAVRNLRFPKGQLFTQEECIALVNAKIADKRIDKIVEMFPGRNSNQIHTCWYKIKKLNPELDEKVKLARAEPSAPAEVEQVNPSVQAAVRNLRFPEGQLFTREESIALVYAKIADKRIYKTDEKFPGRTPKQINNYWKKIRIYNRDLGEIIKLARGGPVEVEQVEPTMGIDQKRNTDVLDESIQPAKRIKRNEISPSAELRLVFSVPLSLGDVLIKRPTGLKYTVEEDIEIINGDIAKKTTNEIVKDMRKSRNQIEGRLRHLKHSIPELENIIRTARSAKARLERMVPPLIALPPEQETDIPRPPNLFENRSISSLFTPEQDEEIFYSKVRGELDKQIAERLGKQSKQIYERWKYLKKTNTELKSKFLEAQRELAANRDRDSMLNNFPLLPNPVVQNPVQLVEPAVEFVPFEQVEPAVEFVPFEYEESALAFDQNSFRFPDL